MLNGFREVARLHARLHEDCAALLRALDDDTPFACVPFLRFLSDVDEHLQTDLTIGYRLFLHHPSEAVRRIAEHVLAEQAWFPPAFDAFREKWSEATEERLRSQLFRDHLETIVSHLLKRIRIEERLVSMISNAA